jgi:hypothetical protein
MAPHLQVLSLVALPEDIVEIRLVPNLKVQSRSHVILFDRGEKSLEEAVIVCPVAIVTRHGNLSSTIGAPKICHK